MVVVLSVVGVLVLELVVLVVVLVMVLELVVLVAVGGRHQATFSPPVATTPLYNAFYFNKQEIKRDHHLPARYPHRV